MTPASDASVPARNRHLRADRPDRPRHDHGSVVVAAAIPVIVVGATATLLALDADLAAATLVLLGIVVAAAGFGRAPAVVAVVACYLGVNVLFTEPTGSVEISKAEDLVPFVAFAVAAIACSQPATPNRVAPLAVVAVGVASSLLVATDASLVVAALVLLAVVVMTAVLGVPAAVTAVAGSYVALNHWFTPPVGSLEITKVADPAPPIASIAAAAAAAGTVARMSWLRRRAAAVERLEFEARLAQATSESRATFFASMTHNLRTPLATIRASISAVLGAARDEPDQRTKLLLNARAETDRLDRLVTKVLQTTRIHAGALTPSPEVVDLAELLGRSAHALHHLATERDLRIVVQGDDLVFASVDPDLLDLAFVVMLENAVKFAPEGSQIDTSVEATGDTARVRVVDRGTGIPVDQRDWVFNEFARLDETAGGTGLGLTIARSIVDAHGGEMWLEETPGGGTTAIARLPAVRTDA